MKHISDYIIRHPRSGKAKRWREEQEERRIAKTQKEQMKRKKLASQKNFN